MGGFMEENKVIKIAPKSLYLLTVHAMFEHIPELVEHNVYPPNFEISHGAEGGNSVGRYHTEFMDMDIPSDSISRAIMPARSSIIFYPERLIEVLAGEFQLDPGQGFQIALAFTVHTIMHEFFHHVRSHRNWSLYIHERYINEIPSDVAYAHYRQFIMNCMETPDDEQYTEGLVLKYFKQVWSSVAPWDQSDGLADNFVDYFRQCYLMPTFREGSEDYEAGMQNLAEICTTISLYGKMMPKYEFIDG